MQVILKRLGKGGFPVDHRQLDQALTQLGLPTSSSLWADVVVNGSKWPKTAREAVAEFFSDLGRTPTEREMTVSWLAADELARFLGWRGASDNRCWPRETNCVLTRTLLPPPSLWTPFDAAVADELVTLKKYRGWERVAFN